MTITSIGYGDIVPTTGNVLEMTFATMIMLLGSFLWAQASPPSPIPSNPSRHP